MLISNHTRLINCFIGLCNNTHDWPSTLKNIGYRVQLIEQTLKLPSGGSVVPDVVVVSNQRHHILVVDCKGGKNIDPDQDARYAQLTLDVLFRFVDVHEPSKTKHKFCYVDTQTHHADLKQYTEHPFVTFDTDIIKGEGDFGEPHTTTTLNRGISIDGMREPTNFYPFSHSDDSDTVAFYVLQGFVSYIIKRGQKKSIDYKSLAPELFKITHVLYKTIGAEHKKQLVKKINEILAIIQGNKQFDECIRQINDGAGSVATLQKLLTLCEGIMADIKQKTRITEFT